MIPRLHVVTDDRILARSDFEAVAAEVLEAGGARVAFHVRGPGSTGRRVFEAATAVSTRAADAGATLLINDRIDVALTVDADGVHLGRRSLPVETVRALVGPERWIGVSIHEVREAEEPLRSGADYLFAGMIFPSPSHPERTPLGIEGLEEIVGPIDRPTIGIGGFTPQKVGAALAAGAHGVAAISGIWGVDEPGAAVESFLRAIESPGDSGGDSGAIRVHLNGEEREIPPGLTLRGLLEHLELKASLVVVELNREIVERERYEDVTVKDGDRLELVHFVGGG